MKGIFFAFLLFVLSSTASAQIIKIETICFDRKVLDSIVEKTDEKIVWVGLIKRGPTEEVGTAALYMNIKTGTWSYVEHWKDISCVVGGGDYSKMQEIKKGDPT